MSDNHSPETEAEVNRLFDIAHKAADSFSKFDLEAVQQIVDAVAKASGEKAEFYAEWAVKETGYGNVSCKTAKNMCSSVTIAEANNVADYVEPVIDEVNKLLSIPKPAGVVVALVPSTNPVATVYYKAMISLMTRNAVILCPHPSAKECSVHAAKFLAEVAEKAGAPKGSVQVLEQPSIPVVDALMKSDLNDLTLATGGPAMVRAAYSSGNPAIGVGPGNVPNYIHQSADLKTVAANTVASVGFDNSVPCTCDSVVLVDAPVADQLWTEFGANGAALITDAEDERRLRELLFPMGKMNPAAIGKTPQWIGDQAGVTIDPAAKIILMKIDHIGTDEPVSLEKMFPVLGFMTVKDEIEGRECALAMLTITGAGHSAAISSNDPNVVIRYSNAMPVCRIPVNSISSFGSAGLVDNALDSGMIIGTGFFGRSSIDGNVGPKHLIQWTRVAYTRDSAVPMGNAAEALSA